MVGYFTAQNKPAAGCRASEVLRHLQHNRYSLVILNLRSEGSDGFETLRQIRVRSDVPVILITGPRFDAADMVVGLELGADDVVAPAVSYRALLARACAILRRQEFGRLSLAEPHRGGVYCFNGWELNGSTRVLKNPAGDTVRLSRKEYALLLAFVDAPHRPLSRVYLMRATGSDDDCFDRCIDVQVLRLRRKLEMDPMGPSIIKTERGIGYVFDATVETKL